MVIKKVVYWYLMKEQLGKLIAQIGAHNILSIISDNSSEFTYSTVIEACYDSMWFYINHLKEDKMKGEIVMYENSIKKEMILGN
jgi:hypothetical protein